MEQQKQLKLGYGCVWVNVAGGAWGMRTSLEEESSMNHLHQDACRYSQGMGKGMTNERIF